MKEPDISTLLVSVYKVMRRYGVSNVVKKLRQIETNRIDLTKSDSIDLIVSVVCTDYKVKRSDLFSRKKAVVLSESKKMAVILMHEEAEMSPKEIAWYFNRHSKSVYRILDEYGLMTAEVKWQRDFLEKKKILAQKINRDQKKSKIAS